MNETAKLLVVGKLQHFVGRFYLRAWADSDEKLYCLQDKRIRQDVIRNLAAENYFYRLQEMNPEDVDFLRRSISESPAGLRASHEQLIEAFTVPHLAKRKLERMGLEDSEHMEYVNETIVELNERFHTGIEEDFQPYLAKMISGDLTFLESAEDATKFYRGLAVQYARTNHVKQTRTIMDRKRLALYKRIANPLVHIVANNVGFSLFADRKRLTVMLLDNATGVPFITADQPVINIAAAPKDTTPPKKFELYYPISPTKAMMLLEPDSAFRPENPSVSKAFVEMYNLRMAAHSYRQVFSDSQQALASVKDTLAAYMSCFPG